jgi:hypothetical protein
MASQQAWDDFEGVKSRVAVINSELAGSIRVHLEELNDLYLAITADPARLAEVTIIANAHPVFNLVYLGQQSGKLITLRSWLIVNGYILE